MRDIKREAIELIHEWEQFAGQGTWQNVKYLFRGEPKEFPKVSSGLYRKYSAASEIMRTFDLREIEQHIISDAAHYTSSKNRLEILGELQHYGGFTNQIDFTRDLAIAIFWACTSTSGYEDENGRLIFLQEASLKEDEIAVHDIAEPKGTAWNQKSVFVDSKKGYLEPDVVTVVIWPFPGELKADLLEHIDVTRGINERTVYADLPGFVRHQQAFGNPMMHYVEGVARMKEGRWEEAIQPLSRYAKKFGGFTGAKAVYQRGFAYWNIGEREKALNDLALVQGIKHTSTGENAYPIPEDILPVLEAWKEQKQKEHTSTNRGEEATEKEGSFKILSVAIKAEQPDHETITFRLMHKSGYSYAQAVTGKSRIMITIPTVLAKTSLNTLRWWLIKHEHKPISAKMLQIQKDSDLTLEHETDKNKNTAINMQWLYYNPEQEKPVETPDGKLVLETLSTTCE